MVNTELMSKIKAGAKNNLMFLKYVVSVMVKVMFMEGLSNKIIRGTENTEKNVKKSFGEKLKRGN